jgi:hypothetical protein
MVLGMPDLLTFGTWYVDMPHLLTTYRVLAAQAHTVATTVAYKPDTDDVDQQM